MTQVSRTITVFNTQSNTPSTITSDATTYGGIKNQVNSGDSYTVVVRETKNELSLNDAVLPEGDFTVYLFPKKVKSGRQFGIDTDNYDGDDNFDVIRAVADAEQNVHSRITGIEGKFNQVLAMLTLMAEAQTMSPEQREELRKVKETTAMFANEASSLAAELGLRLG